jgi:citrate lyase subunit beta/citryl-CoA lyase
MGTNDLAKELYAEHVPGRHPLLPGLGLALLAARATGKAILDGVYNDVKDLGGFLAECRQGREMGFDGKTLVHPGQVEGANETFAPSPEAVADARGAWSPTRAGWSSTCTWSRQPAPSPCTTRSARGGSSRHHHHRPADAPPRAASAGMSL